MRKKKTLECTIIGIQDYGIFVQCGEYEGLVHISEISDQYIDNIHNIFNVGEKMNLMQLDIDEENKKLRLSYKKSHPISSKIRKHVPIVKGFHSLKNSMDYWIENKKGDD